MRSRRYDTKLEIQKNTLESRSFKLSTLKIKYMECKCSENISMDDVMIKFKDQVTLRKDQFKYLGSIIQKYEENTEDVTCIIKA